MLQYSNEQLATIIGVPIVTILLIWTVAIFHKNRKKLNSYDIAVVAILVQSILRNFAILTYTAILIAKRNNLNTDYCRSVVWIFNSLHTFQASSLTTLAVIALFTVKLYRKQQSLQQYLTPTHLIYHLFCLTTLCACVGVAAILAQEDLEGPTRRTIVTFGGAFNGNTNGCKFMPFELDVKFNIFIIVLHIFLSMVSLTSFIFICLNHVKMRRRGFDYLKKSTSDLSELSLSLTNPNNENKAYYDTYTVQRIPQLQLDGSYANVPGINYEGHPASCGVNRGGGGGGGGVEHVWNSDFSNISMTVSSTNSKRPCLNKSLQEEEEETGLHTMYPILAVCYLFNHLPMIVLCIFPRLVFPWPVSGAALWMGQLQDVLIPIGLGLVDTRFCRWVSSVYKCSERKRTVDKVPPGVGLDGKFRHFGSQPQSLEATHHTQVHQERIRTEPKFPITNGSLYTSIDGRLPIIHNYRRHKEHRGYLKPPAHSLNVNLHSTHLRRQQERPMVRQEYPAHTTTSLDVPIPKRACPKCESHFGNQVMLNQHQARLRQDFRNRRLLKRVSLSQDSLSGRGGGVLVENISPSMKLMLMVQNQRKKRMSKSHDSLSELHRDLAKFKQNPESFQKKPEQNSCISSDEEYFTDGVNPSETVQDFDATSQSSYSITTEANCDFEFYQNKELDEAEAHVEPEVKQSSHNLARSNSRSSKSSNPDLRNFRITRSNSKRSLENFHSYIDEEVEFLSEPKMQRSSSYMTIEDRKRLNHVEPSQVGPTKIMLKNFNTSIAYLEDVYNHNVDEGDERRRNRNKALYAGSVPDFKKIFISEYI